MAVAFAFVIFLLFAKVEEARKPFRNILVKKTKYKSMQIEKFFSHEN